MNSAMINFKTDPRVKKEAQEVVGRLGFSLSSVLNAFLRDLIRTRTIEFSDDVRLELTPYAKRMVKRSEEDIKAGRVTSFSNSADALAYLDTMIADEEKHRLHRVRRRVQKTT